MFGATTREGLLSGPLRSRFGLVERLEAYPPADIRRILERAAGLLGVAIDAAAADLLAARSRGIPRMALRLQRRIRDLAQVRGRDRIEVITVQDGLSRLGIDELGLEEIDRRILRTLAERGEPTGLKTLAAMVDEAEDTIEDVFEPHLMRCGLLARTPRGRVLTPRGHAHLGLEGPAAARALGTLPFE
jgi:Holliday junction DNA helicase RuvB